jgi:putative ABC transport system permease protein
MSTPSRISSPNKKFVRHIIKHYLKYDKENPFIFISAMLAFLGISAGVVMNYPLTVLPLEEDAVNDDLITLLREQFPHLQFKMTVQYRAL